MAQNPPLVFTKFATYVLTYTIKLRSFVVKS